MFANALERKNAEQKLRASEARLSLAAASANAGLWTLDPDTGQIWATDELYELLGLSPVDTFNLEKFLAVVHPEDREPVRQVIRDATQSGSETSTEYRVVLVDGSVRWIASRGSRQGGDHGEPIDSRDGYQAEVQQFAIAPVSEKKLGANRRNAQASTVPKSEHGKQRSRCNAVKHGILASEALIMSVATRWTVCILGPHTRS